MTDLNKEFEKDCQEIEKNKFYSHVQHYLSIEERVKRLEDKINAREDSLEYTEWGNQIEKG